MAQQIPAAVRTLERDLRSVFGDRLQSIVAYGLATREAPDAPRSHDGAPPTETLVVVDTIGGEDLRACSTRVGSWHDAGLATPLFLAAGEFARSLDAFPLEFGAILANHAVVWGRNPFEGLGVADADLRRACEVQARSHLLHLREGYVETRGRGDALAVLIVRSAPAFAALLQSLARLEGLQAMDAAAAGRHAEHVLGAPPGSITDIVQLADVAEIPSAEAVRVFPPYLEAVGRLVGHVDRWGRP
jgi:hypothetical protein